MSLARRFENAIERMAVVFGTEDGRPLTATLERQARTSSSKPYDPDFATTTYNCTVLFGRFTAAERASGRVTDKDHVLLIGADPGPTSSTGARTAPEVGDHITVKGLRYEIKTVGRARPGGVDLIYRAIIRE